MFLFLVLFLIIAIPVLAFGYFLVKHLKAQKQENFEKRSN